jgi:hypothetical protein
MKRGSLKGAKMPRDTDFPSSSPSSELAWVLKLASKKSSQLLMSVTTTLLDGLTGNSKTSLTSPLQQALAQKDSITLMGHCKQLKLNHWPEHISQSPREFPPRSTSTQHLPYSLELSLLTQQLKSQLLFTRMTSTIIPMDIPYQLLTQLEMLSENQISQHLKPFTIILKSKLLTLHSTGKA